MPSIIISRAPGIALAVALPPEGRIILSTVPWMTRVGALIAASLWCDRPRRRSRRAGGRPPGRRSRGRRRGRRARGCTAHRARSRSSRPGRRSRRSAGCSHRGRGAGAEQVAIDGGRGLAVPAAARRGHDRGERADELGMLGRQHLADHAAHRGAHHVGGRDSSPRSSSAVSSAMSRERVLLGPELRGGASGPRSAGGSRSGSSGRCRGCRSGPRRSHARRARSQKSSCQAIICVARPMISRIGGVVRVAEGLVAEGHAPADVAELLGHPDDRRARPRPSAAPLRPREFLRPQRILHSC